MSGLVKHDDVHVHVRTKLREKSCAPDARAQSLWRGLTCTRSQGRRHICQQSPDVARLARVHEAQGGATSAHKASGLSCTVPLSVS